MTDNENFKLEDTSDDTQHAEAPGPQFTIDYTVPAETHGDGNRTETEMVAVHFTDATTEQLEQVLRNLSLEYEVRVRIGCKPLK